MAIFKRKSHQARSKAAAVAPQPSSKSAAAARTGSQATRASTASAVPPLDTKALTRELKIDAKALGIPAGAAEDFISRAVAVAASPQFTTAKARQAALVRELKKYNQDLAYICQNRDKII